MFSEGTKGAPRPKSPLLLLCSAPALRPFPLKVMGVLRGHRARAEREPGGWLERLKADHGGAVSLLEPLQ